MNKRHISIILLFLLGGLVAGFFRAPSATVQAQTGWSEPVNLSNSEAQSLNPAMAVDPAGGVHVVWSEETGDGRSFVGYAQFRDGNWLPMNEIITSPESQHVENPTIAADSRGYLHLVWRGDATLYYSQAYAQLAGTAQSWSTPQALEFTQNNISHPHLVSDNQDRLHLVYAISIDHNSGIYYMQASESGKYWSDPVTIYQNTRSDRMVNMTRLAIDPSGKLHAVWVEYNYPEIFPPLGIRYASSDDGQIWSDPVSLADGPYGYPAIITRGENEVHVVYSGTNPDRYKFHVWSVDSGQSWLAVYRNGEVGGFQGLPSLAIDSGGYMHWLTTATIFSINKDGVYHADWRDGQWRPGEVLLENITVGQQPWDVAAAVALGNELHVAIQYSVPSSVQVEGWQYEIYVMRKALDTPRIQPETLPEPTRVEPTATKVGGAGQAIDITPTIPLNREQPRGLINSPLYVIAAGLLASLGLVVVLLLAGRRRQ